MFFSPSDAKANASGLCCKSKQHIVITGCCEYEILGIWTLLEAEGFSVHSLAKMKPSRDDLLIVGLSALPELGWWYHLDLLENLKSLYRCRIIAVVPGALKRAVSVLISGDREVIAGDEAFSVFRYRLVLAVSRWQEAHPVEAEKGGPQLSSRMTDALHIIIAGGNKNITKTQYNYRYLALRRLKFSDAMQFRLFMAGCLQSNVR